MEVLLQHPEKTLSEVLHEVYKETGSELICVFNAFLLFETQQHYAKEGWYITYVYIELLLRYCV